MKKLYLHIGPHKTGSTYIQKILYENRHELKICGLYYPDNLIGPQWGHHKLVEAIKKRDDDTVSAFLKTLEQCSIISSENFENLNEEEVTYFFSKVGNMFEVEVIFVKRAYSNLLISNWQEDIKHGSDVAWPGFLLNNLLRPFKSLILNQVSTVKLWDRFCQNTNIIVYENSSDLVDSVLNLTNIKFDRSYSSKARINASLNLNDVELIRILNSLYIKDHGRSPGTTIRDGYLDLRRQSDAKVLSAIKVIENSSVEMELSSGWGINFFEKQFFKILNLEEEMPNSIHNKYKLPSPNIEYLGLLQGKVQEIYERIVEE